MASESHSASAPDPGTASTTIFTVPRGQVVTVQTVAARITLNGGNPNGRVGQLAFLDQPGNVLYSNQTGIGVGSPVVKDFLWARYGAEADIDTDPTDSTHEWIQEPIPSIELAEGFSVQINIVGVDAADTITNIVLSVDNQDVAAFPGVFPLLVPTPLDEAVAVA